MADTQTAAVIGTLDSEGARASIPLLNEAGFLHVSLGAGYAGFTRPRRRRTSPSACTRPAGGRSPASSATTARRRARSCAPPGRAGSWSRPRAGRTARRWRREVRRAARPRRAKVVAEPGRDGAVIYAGEDPVAAAGVAESVARESPGARVVLPDEVVRAGVEGRLRGPRRAPHGARLARAGAGLDAGAARVRGRVRAHLGRRPGPYAALGHAAMETVLAALARAAQTTTPPASASG